MQLSKSLRMLLATYLCYDDGVSTAGHSILCVGGTALYTPCTLAIFHVLRHMTHEVHDPPLNPSYHLFYVHSQEYLYILAV